MSHRAYEGNEPYIFVSYAHKDSERVLPIISALQERGFRVWYDAGIEAGTEWPEYIADHLDRCSCFLAFMSEYARDSHNCRREINFAIELRKEPLVIYLENVQMSLGMRMQLGSLQAIFYNRHSNLDSFIAELSHNQFLMECQINRTVSRQEIIQWHQNGKVCFINENFVEAVTWFHKAAELELADAEVYLSVCYLLGLGVEQDEAKAIQWLLKVVETDEKDSSLWRIALCNEKGLGISQNEIE